MPIRVQDELPAVNFLRDEKRLRDDHIACYNSGNPPAEGVNSQSDAQEDRDGESVPAAAVELAAAG